MVLDQLKQATFHGTAPQMFTDRSRELDSSGRNAGQTQGPAGEIHVMLLYRSVCSIIDRVIFRNSIDAMKISRFMQNSIQDLCCVKFYEIK